MADSTTLLIRRSKRDRIRRILSLPQAPVGRSHFHRLIRGLELEGGPYYTVAEVAWIIERTEKTVKEWHRKNRVYPSLGTPGASKQMVVYGQLVYLYTEEDVERHLRYAERHK